MPGAIENFVLRFKVEGQQGIKQISGCIKNLSDDLAAFGNSGGVFGNTISGILGKLGPLGLAAGAAGGAFVALGLKAIDLADALDDLSGATGISASEILSLKKSIIDAGGGADDYVQMLSKLRQGTEEAAAGNEKFRKAFQDIGVYVLDANGKMRPTSDILQNILEKFQKGEIGGKAYAAAVDILGKDINRLDLTKLKAINDPFQDEQIKQLAKYKTAIDNISNSISNSLIKVFGTLAMKIDEQMKKVDEVNKKAEDRAKKLGITEEELNKKGRTGVFDLGGGLKVSPGGGMTREMTPAEKAAYEKQKQSGPGAGRGVVNPPLIGTPSTSGRTPNAGSFGGVSEAEIKAAEDARLRITISGIEAERLARLRLVDEITAIEINKKYDIDKITKEINSKKDLGPKLKAEEIAAKTLEIERKSVNDIAKIREQSTRTLNEQI
jgi:DNA-binding ferritin-like protein (Dps family)